MLLAEEMLNLTLDELINDFGAEFTFTEDWYGVDYSISLDGTLLYAAPSDLFATPDETY